MKRRWCRQWAASLSGMTEMFCDFAVTLIVIVRDCRRARTGRCAGTAKVCLTELINQTAWASVSSWPWKPRRHSRVRNGEGRGHSKSSVITLHPLIIQWDTESGAWLAQPTCALKVVWARTCGYRCEHLDLLTCELCDLFTLSSPAKWQLKILTRNWGDQSWHWTVF